MSPAGRTSGEWAAQGEFSGFATEVRGFMAEQRTQNGVIMSMLAEGQSTMAVLRRDTAEYKNRSDEASSKIRLLAQSEAVRVDRERREETQTLPALPPPKPTFWQDAVDELRKKAISVIAVVALYICYDQLQKFMAFHPAAGIDGDGISLPSKDEHHSHENRRPIEIQVIPPASPTSPAVTPPKP
jgi:hypothetical protein